ncbi:PREDICTED: telomeric repeat-binding factor 2-interacting protein 1 [Gavialis gangeticus]|uniref:telomeric repeat-binding factor 2-interacting protein 1 n=1 Tax=Gavialis gangeticus TaxID=94835 RepID=UPI00092E7C02|nr:PREDICTED: telomeric repeat-binding factor 2-interacting protein 1 [Gavialis gangeticus]
MCMFVPFASCPSGPLVSFLVNSFFQMTQLSEMALCVPRFTIFRGTRTGVRGKETESLFSQPYQVAELFGKAAAAIQEKIRRRVEKGGSLFKAASREFESDESESETDLPEEIPGEDKEMMSPEKAGPSQKMDLNDSDSPPAAAAAARDSPTPETQPQWEESPASSGPAPTQVADAVKAIKYCMEELSMDLLTVTQAFLKNSGEVEATVCFLKTSQRLDGHPIWSREDDLELQKDDENVRSKLIAKFGAENVGKRIAFRRT